MKCISTSPWTVSSIVVEMEAAHRAAVLGEGVDHRDALRRDEIADGLAGEILLADPAGEAGIDRRALALGADGDDGEELVLRPGEIELLLRMLVDRAERGDRLGALPVLAEALGPELDPPARQQRELVGIGHQHGDALARAHRGEMQRRAERGGRLAHALAGEHRRQRLGRAGAEGARCRAPASAAGSRPQLVSTE